MEDKENESLNFESLCHLEMTSVKIDKIDKRKKRQRESDIESELQVKKEKALKNMQKILSISEGFSLYCARKMKESAKELEQTAQANNPVSGKGQLLKELSFFCGTLRPYQVEGVIWLKVLFENALSGILADEMGLGKTIQIIALLCHLIEKEVSGPFLIIVPLSTLPNWAREFEKFAPDIPVVTFHGDKEARLALSSKVSQSYPFNGRYVKPVVITTAQMIRMELRVFTQICWMYMIIDEAQCIKNHEARISQDVRSIKSSNKILLTGTPLQNNLQELWALLNFVMPKIFKNMETFQFLLLTKDLEDKNNIVKEQQATSVISLIHSVLAPFMLRRLKCDVLTDIVPKKEVLIYCPLSKLQRTLYMDIIQKNLDRYLHKHIGETVDFGDDINQPRPKRKCTINKNYTPYLHNDVDDDDAAEFVEINEDSTNQKDAVEDAIEKFAHRITMQNSMSMFKKTVAHPFLIQCPVTKDRKNIIVDERLVTKSGKMLVLDAILPKLKAQGHKILLFSTSVMMLDLLEEYMIMRKYTYCRLDGNQSISVRDVQVEAFNNDPVKFVFLISTRAGGLGLNLIGADTVIFYDRDWNPQADIQAQDRCHRIGQTKPVMVYSLITKNTIDEKIMECGNRKRRLEKIVIKNGQFQKLQIGRDIDIQELKKLLENDFSPVHANGIFYTDEELEALLDRRELYDKVNK